MIDFLLATLLIGILAALIRVSRVVVRRCRRGEPLVAPEPPVDIYWGLPDFAIAIVLLFCLNALASGLVDRHFEVVGGEPADAIAVPYYRWRVIGLSLASVTTWLLSSGMIRLRRGQRKSRFELPGVSWLRDLRLGFAAFLVLGPPTYALQFLLIQWIESKHPIVELMQEHPDVGLILASITSAVLVAPVFEEYLFRGLLQGSLEKLLASHTASDHHGHDRSLGDSGNERPEHVTAVSHSHSVDELDSGADDLQQEPTALDAGPAVTRLAQLTPNVVTSILFAGLHYAHGPDWIPLFFLSLGLGYLYHQTHRLLPSITVHFLLNACSMGMLVFDLLAQ